MQYSAIHFRTSLEFESNLLVEAIHSKAHESSFHYALKTFIRGERMIILTH